MATGYDGVSEFVVANSSHQAWRIDVYRAFSPLPEDAYWIDDLICMYRANVLGYCVCLPTVVVMVRTGSLNMSRGGCDNKRGFASIMRLERFNDKYYNTTYTPLKKIN